MKCKFSPIVKNLIAQGFTVPFEYLDGKLVSNLLPRKTYSYAAVHKNPPMPCILSETIVYSIITSDGVKGFVVFDWPEPDDY